MVIDSDFITNHCQHCCEVSVRRIIHKDLREIVGGIFLQVKSIEAIAP
jgi:hypothetical protein